MENNRKYDGQTIKTALKLKGRDAQHVIDTDGPFTVSLREFKSRAAIVDRNNVFVMTIFENEVEILAGLEVRA